MEDNKFNQLCVWEGTFLGNNMPEEFEDFMKENFNARIKFCEEVITNGSIERNEEGGRHDLLFYVHDDDISHFSLERFKVGIRWWEDVVSYNNGAYLYTNEILEKYPVTW